jgi:Uma2 family endonuclease
MSTSTSTLLTVDEYLRLEPREDGLKDELIEGEIVLSPSAKPSHAKIVANLFDLLKPLTALGFARAADFGCRLGEYSLPGPDLAAIRSERWNSVAEDDYLVGSPELVIEVFSPSNRKALMAQKAALYLRYGAEMVWVVYPKQRTITIHEGESQKEARCGETVSFHGVIVPVAAIFERL